LEYAAPLADVLTGVILHHSALPLTDGPQEIQRLHMEEKGFADIGYHFLVDEAGLIYAGRPLDVRGAHAYGCNYGTVGICMIGNFEEIDPTAQQLAALDALLRDLAARYPGLRALAGHKDCNPGTTLCPGARFFPRLPEIAQAHGLTYGV
jgi:N-acetyl-anhydromuramyl-L-alanine amidase AmpD